MAVTLVAAVAVTVAAFSRTSAGGAPGYTAPATTEQATPSAPALTLPGRGSSVLFFGDSYTEGYGAKPETNGYAYLVAADLGWNPTIDAVNGTGYLNPGQAGATYAQRVATLPDITPALVILQGGLHDQDMSPTRPAIIAAATQVVDAVRAKYPAAQILLFGPVQPRRVSSRELTIIDDALHRVALEQRLPWVSPLEERWDVSGHLISDKSHPDNEGYRYLADQLIRDLRAPAVG